MFQLSLFIFFMFGGSSLLFDGLCTSLRDAVCSLLFVGLWFDFIRLLCCQAASALRPQTRSCLKLLSNLGQSSIRLSNINTNAYHFDFIIWIRPLFLFRIGDIFDLQVLWIFPGHLKHRFSLGIGMFRQLDSLHIMHNFFKYLGQLRRSLGSRKPRFTHVMISTNKRQAQEARCSLLQADVASLPLRWSGLRGHSNLNGLIRWLSEIICLVFLHLLSRHWEAISWNNDRYLCWRPGALLRFLPHFLFILWPSLFRTLTNIGLLTVTIFALSSVSPWNIFISDDGHLTFGRCMCGLWGYGIGLIAFSGFDLLLHIFWAQWVRRSLLYIYCFLVLYLSSKWRLPQEVVLVVELAPWTNQRWRWVLH